MSSGSYQGSDWPEQGWGQGHSCRAAGVIEESGAIRKAILVFRTDVSDLIMS